MPFFRISNEKEYFILKKWHYIEGRVNYQEIHLGQPPAGTFDLCQAIHEGHNL